MIQRPAAPLWCAAPLALALGWIAPSRAEPTGVQLATHAQNDLQDDEVAKRVRLLTQLIASRRDDPSLTAQLLQLTADLPPEAGAAAFGELADARARAGDFNAAAEACRLIVSRYPDQPAALEAGRWLVALYGSSEVAHAQSPARADGADATSAGDQPSGGGEFAEYAAATAQRLTAQHKAWDEDPPLLLTRTAALRRLGGGEAGLGALRPLKRRPAGDPWGDAARCESWLLDPSDDQPPKPLIPCPAVEPPLVDGVLDDLCWRAAAAVPLDAIDRTKQPDVPLTSFVHFTHDHEYLYIAVRAARNPRIRVATPDASLRTHDSASRRGDHVRLLLDLDRDYATWFELVIDARGHTADGVWNDPTWNPTWYVAAAAEQGAWQAEAAIPWSSLTTAPPPAGAAWAVAIDRPRDPSGRPAHAFGDGRNELGPDAFGILRFE